MNEENDSERDLDHPLFRALVLMGGGLALSCGGSAVIDGNGAGGGGARAVGGAPQAGTSPGGASHGGGGASAFGGGGASALGGGGANAVDTGAPECPPAQWDCTALGVSCNYYWTSQAKPDGCVCDPKRPKSVADCGANEDLFCLGAGTAPPDQQSWDGQRHVQCTCVPVKATPVDYTECQQDCATIYPDLNQGGIFTVSCSQPQSETCDAFGNNCTATPTSVLRQDGIVCGCASIVLK